VHHARVSIHSDVRLHPKVPLVTHSWSDVCGDRVQLIPVGR
jgi:hypothetical protein